MADRTKVITICGSTRFIGAVAVAAWIIERDEGAITMSMHILPSWYCETADHFAEECGVADHMDDLHLRKIDLSDEIFVVDVGGYIGESTSREIAYARKHGKSVRMLSRSPSILKEIERSQELSDG